MLTRIPSVRTTLSPVVLAAALAGVTACASQVRLGVPPTRADIITSPSTGTIQATPCAEPPTVVIREYSHSPTVSVVGWDPAQAGFGLRAALRRDGTLIRDHRLYVSTYYFADWYAFLRADWHAFTGEMALARPLRSAGLSRDVQACEGNGGCSPYETLRVRIPDAFLRASQDSIVVKIHGRNGSEEIITLRRDLIDAYLQTVTAVSAALRKDGQTRGAAAPRPPAQCLPAAGEVTFARAGEIRLWAGRQTPTS